MVTLSEKENASCAPCSERAGHSQLNTACRVCGATLRLPWEATGDATIDKCLLGLAGKVVCDPCHDAWDARWLKEHIGMARTKKALDWGGICPPLYQGTDPAKLSPKIVAKLDKWAPNASGLLLHGPSGTQKTRAVFYRLRREHEAGKAIVAMTHSDFADEGTAMQIQPRKEQERWMDTMKTCDILFIDDLGKSRFTNLDGKGKAAEEFLFSICEYRWTHQRCCVFTSNDTGESISARMTVDRGMPFVRRLREFSTIVSTHNP